ncbi:MAG: efflux RND transporter periplasmic adaptor subunit [Bacteroidia bacterium]|jgi:membrane fusion protein (multidrug efflux system)|nr:efflux RND transporter periplasmic adaptor subunit [Bacteroidia bacterium]
MNKKIIWIFIGILSSACGRKSNNAEEHLSTTVSVIQPHQKDIVTPVDYVADIHALQNVEIRARIQGYLGAIYVDEGKVVQKGQLLFKINDEEYRAKYNSAKANLKSAEAELKSAMVELARVKLLVDKNVIAKTEIDLAEAKVETAKARIEQAKAEETDASVRLANTEIRSPFNGVIDRIPYKLGSLISEGTLLTTISDLHAVYAYFKVSEIEYLQILKEQLNAVDTMDNNQVELLLADGSMYAFKGRIETMESEIETGTGSLAFRAKFANPNRILKHGSTGKIRITEHLKSAILIPQKSTLEIQDKNYVMLVDKNNMLVMKSFKPLQRFGDFYVVESGLNPQDRMVYEGVQNLKEGTVIQIETKKQEDVYRAINTGGK